jgi:hypothetical protein
MTLKLAPQCCCTPANCDDAVIVSFSGVTNGTCTSCGTQWNDSWMSNFPLLGPTGAICGITPTTRFCSWEWATDSSACFTSNDNLVRMFEASGQKYIAISLEDSIGFGTDIVFWIKPIAAYTFPQTLGPDEFCSGTSICQFANATIVVTQ